MLEPRWRLGCPSTRNALVMSCISAVCASFSVSVSATVPTWDLALWEQLDEVGLARLTGSEASGGSGATWFAAAELLDAAARFGVPTPVVEHDLLAGWLLDEAALQ